MTKVILLKNKTTPTDAYETHFGNNGFNPVFVPLIRHFHLPEEALVLLKDREYLDKLKYIIVTSQRTVECLNESIMPQLSVEHRDLLKQKVIYTVGPATSSFLENSGFSSVRGGVEVGNGALLADLILETIEDKDFDHFLFLVGEIRRDVIPKKLKSNGFKVNEVVTYRTEDLNDNLEKFKLNAFSESSTDEGASAYSWVVFFSPQGTEDIIQLLKRTPGFRCASIGPTTKQFLLDKGLTPDVVSDKPEPVSLFNAIKHFNESI